MAENKVNQFGRITLAMLGVGLGVGLASFFTWEWIDAIVLPGIEDPVIRSAIAEIVSLAFLIVAALGAPIVAGLIGIFEGLRSSTTKQAMVVGVAVLVGAAIMVVVAAIFIGFTGPESDNGENGIGFLDVVSLAGLCGMASFLTGAIAVKFGAK